MNVLLTGGRGFIGRHLSVELSGHGHTVKQIDREDGDLRDHAVANEIIVQSGADVVVHLAAKIGRAGCEVAAKETIESNATMTYNVARATRRIGARLVYFSTSEVYGGTQHPIGLGEHSELRPINIYGLAKKWGEEVARLYSSSNLTIIRPSMFYGTGTPPGWNRAAITNFIWNAMTRKRIVVHHRARRSWCWIDDGVRAIRLVIEMGMPGAINVGREDDERSMYEVAEMACCLAGAPFSLIKVVDPPDALTVIKRLSMTRLSSTGWEPRVSLYRGMRRVMEWLSYNKDKFDETESGDSDQEPGAATRAVVEDDLRHGV